jgi:FG-GAP-like repeat
MSLHHRCRVFARLCCLLLLAAAGSTFAQSRFVVTSTANSGAGSLREALTAANASPDRSTIDFDIDANAFGSGPWAIAVDSDLPEATAPVLIRGFSQPGSIPPSSIGNGRLMIELRIGASAKFGLLFVRGAEGSSVSGLAFVNGPLGEAAAAVLLLTHDTRITSSYIGLHADGTPERFRGTAIGAICADRITVGGPQASSGNVFYGSDVAIMTTGSGHVVQNNWFGMGRDGISRLDGLVYGDALITGRIALIPPQHLQGMYSVAVQQSFFGLRDALIADNRFGLVSGNAVQLLGANNPTRGNRIERNVFGRDALNGPDAHVDVAVRLSSGAQDNLISNNTVAHANSGFLLGNALESPPTLAGSGNRISNNLLQEVAFPLIGLDAANQFDPLRDDMFDADAGPNNLQNKPELTAASSAGGLEGWLTAAPQQTYTIEYFLGSACHPAGFGPAEFFLGSQQVSTDVIGRAALALTLPNRPLGGLQAGDVISATATDAGGNTSELSHCVGVAAAIVPTVKMDRIVSPRPAMDTSLALRATVDGNGTRQPVGDVVFYARSDTERRELGRVALRGNLAELPAPAQGLLVNPGRYRIEADYSGDGFHAPASATAQNLVVFRPALALLERTLSNLAARYTASGDRTYYDFPASRWQRLALRTDESWIDADRFYGDALDRVLALDPRGVYTLVDGRGTRSRVTSRVLSANASVLDLLQLDGDARADAIVRDPAQGYLAVRCIFFLDGCETAERLPVNPEFTFVLSGEFNGDGRADLAWRNPTNGEIEVWIMGGDARPLRIERVRPVFASRLSAAADVNGDGYEDLVWLDRGANVVTVMLMDAGRVRGSLTAPLAAGSWTLAGPLQLGSSRDRDYGLGQLLLHEAGSGEAQVWRDMRSGLGVLQYRPNALYYDPGLVPERTR